MEGACSCRHGSHTYLSPVYLQTQPREGGDQGFGFQDLRDLTHPSRKPMEVMHRAGNASRHVRLGRCVAAPRDPRLGQEEGWTEGIDPSIPVGPTRANFP